MANNNISITNVNEFVPEVWLDQARDLLGYDGEPRVRTRFEISTLAHRITLSFLGHEASVTVENPVEVQANRAAREKIVEQLVAEWRRTYPREVA